jgi:hypothetical protein
MLKRFNRNRDRGPSGDCEQNNSNAKHGWLPLFSIRDPAPCSKAPISRRHYTETAAKRIGQKRMTVSGMARMRDRTPRRICRRGLRPTATRH